MSSGYDPSTTGRILRDKIIQISATTFGEMPGITISVVYGLSESGNTYYLTAKGWTLVCDSPERE